MKALIDQIEATLATATEAGDDSTCRRVELAFDFLMEAAGRASNGNDKWRQSIGHARHHCNDLEIAMRRPEVVAVLSPEECEDCLSMETTFSPCPYSDEIFNDQTPVWLCEDCAHSRAQDI